MGHAKRLAEAGEDVVVLIDSLTGWRSATATRPG